MRALLQRRPALGAALAAIAVTSACGGAVVDRPNVLLVTIDTLRADHVGAYGYPRDTTARLDDWMAGAVRFADAQASSSWTLHSLASLLTSQHGSSHGCLGFRSKLAESQITLTEHLAAAGYHTHGIPTHVYLGRKYGLHQGFAQYEDELLAGGPVRSHEAITSPSVTRLALEFLEGPHADPGAEPWFLWLHYFDPHEVYYPHEGVSERFGTAREEDLYDGEIAFTDHHVGRVLDALEERGLGDRTVVVFASDHGEEWRDHGRLGHGHSLHEELVRVPLAVSAPGFAARVIPATVSLVDILPTVLDLCGLPHADLDVAGRSLVPLLGGADLAPRPALLEVELRERDSYRAVVEEGWKLIESLPEGEVRLYDRRADPAEQVDVSAAHPEEVARLRGELERLVSRALERARRHGEEPDADLSGEELRALIDMGYADADGEDAD